MSLSSNCSSVVVFGCLCIGMFGVNTENYKLSSMYARERQWLQFISVSTKTSFSSCFVNVTFPIALCKYCFTSPTILLKLPPQLS